MAVLASVLEVLVFLLHFCFLQRNIYNGACIKYIYADTYI